MGISPERLRLIRARTGATTPPPWILVPPQCGPEGQTIAQKETCGPIVDVGDPYPRGENRPQENMEFILHARNEDVPDLCDAYEEVVYALEQVERIMGGKSEDAEFARQAIDCALRGVGWRSSARVV